MKPSARRPRNRWAPLFPADFIFDEISPESAPDRRPPARDRRDDPQPGRWHADGRLAPRLCGLIFLIRKLPREAAIDIGVRATADMLADLLVADLSKDGTALRSRIPQLLDDRGGRGTLMKIESEYSLQTRESSEWDREFRNRQTRLIND